MSLKNNDKILVTGGAGFIGSHVVDSLLHKGAQVLIVDNYVTGRPENNKTHPNLIILNGSIADSHLVDQAFLNFKPQLVIHAAASYKNPLDWTEDIRTNGLGMVNLINGCKSSGVDKIIYLQTSLCYGLQSLYSPVTIGAPYFSGGYSGGSSYAISKTIGELYLEFSGMDFISFRLANTYGPRNMTGPVPAFYKNIMRSEEVTITNTRRDFIYVQDVVDAILMAVDFKVANGYYHLSTGQDISIKELYDEMIDIIKPINTPLVQMREKGDDDAKTILIDPADTHAAFGWKAKIGLAEGIFRTIQEYRHTGIGETYTHLKGIGNNTENGI